MKTWTAAFVAALLVGTAGAEDVPGLTGRVTDVTGGAIAGAEVTATGPSGAKTTRTDAGGVFSFVGLGPGTYAVTVYKEGFTPFGNGAVTVAGSGPTTLDVKLELARLEENVTVKSAAPALSIDPDENAGAIVIKGQDLEALPDDPDELSDALQALAGPAAGPNGGQVFIDGFTGGRMPPKSSIREIRINANPFSAEYDRLGFGRIEILTKPGTDVWHGESQLRFNDAGLNTRNPFASNKPPYQRKEWGGNLSGPIVAQKASFFLDFEKRDVDDNALVNATTLAPDLTPLTISQAFLTPSHRTSLSPRVDWQPSASHTISLRYTYASTDQTSAGIGGFSLPSRGYDTSSEQNTFQLTDTLVFGKTVNETRARYWTETSTQQGDDAIPTLQVLDAFTGGGAQVGASSNSQKRFELQNITSWTSGAHALRAGVRLRTASIDDVARQGFGGTVLFGRGIGPALDAAGNVVLGPDGAPLQVQLTSLDRFRRTLQLAQLGLSAATIRALGGGATQLQISGGNPEATVGQWDVAPFVQDDWKIRPDLLLSVGLRYELQDNIDSRLNLAPRLGFAWSPGAGAGPGQSQGPASAPKTVVRGGFGVFYDRVGEDLTLRANRYDGSREQQYVVSDPSILDELAFTSSGASNVPSTAALAAFALPQTTWRLSPTLQSPYTLQSSLSVERQLPKNFTLTTTFVATEGRRSLRAVNVNAPRADGSFPLGAAAGGVYEIDSTGRSNTLQAIVGLNNRFSQKLTLFFRYFLSRARSDTDGSDTFPASTYDLADEYGRASNDVRHRFVLGGNVTGPWDLRFAPFVIASTGRPYNITLGDDLNGDGLFADRPAYANDPTKPGLVSTPYGLLDPNPTPDEVLIPRNLGVAPGFVMVNLRVSRTISFGRNPAAGGDQPRGGPGGFGGGFGGRGGRRGADDGPAGGSGARGLTLSLSAQNLMNHVNRTAPVGNLSSPLFGQSLGSAGGFGFGPGGSSASGGNRRIELQGRLSF